MELRQSVHRQKVSDEFHLLTIFLKLDVGVVVLLPLQALDITLQYRTVLYTTTPPTHNLPDSLGHVRIGISIGPKRAAPLVRWE
ncbi:hypothetical protein NXS19_012517 [Fusarium pseudograminearum]|nr:hypothetical protein NXS19_012517 [Fusarium pseudograminearum]